MPVLYTLCEYNNFVRCISRLHIANLFFSGYPGRFLSVYKSIKSFSSQSVFVTTAFLSVWDQWQWLGKSTKRPGRKGRARKEYYKAIQRGNEIIRVGGFLCRGVLENILRSLVVFTVILENGSMLVLNFNSNSLRVVFSLNEFKLSYI